ncbi:hypothetical protein M5K25_009188 [Dendrobium thyrsiflorum]|uniref:Uncharacterized protein n=1 Tax=Dendrobium thyrsiflorum TaxID=117978 RepID=A0ABD0V4T3_DENTH
MSAQQVPPGRSWFRLASLARTEAAAASAASNNPPPPLPRIPVPRSQQQPPPATVLAAPDQPPPLQPPPPPESPKVISPSYSTTPPSIGQKPNPEPEPEPPKNNTVPEQGILNGKENKKINGKAKEEEERRLITLAGKNIGAKMEFGLGSMSEERNNGEEKAEDLAVKAKPKRLVVNSNVQSINNSIVLNATLKQHSPGVHVNFARARQLKGSQATEKYWSTDE